MPLWIENAPKYNVLETDEKIREEIEGEGFLTILKIRQISTDTKRKKI
jgi:hypothetical protein